MRWLTLLLGVALGIALEYFLPRDWSIAVLIAIAVAVVVLRLARRRSQG